MSKEVNWQQECLKKGFEYVREPDDHYVVASPAEMVALLRDLLGVDVRTKDCDSYGVAVCELQEKIDGLVNTIHAQQAERDALIAERDAISQITEIRCEGCGYMAHHREHMGCLLAAMSGGPSLRELRMLDALEYALPYLEACIPNPRNGVNHDGSMDVNAVQRARDAVASCRAALQGEQP